MAWLYLWYKKHLSGVYHFLLLLFILYLYVELVLRTFDANMFIINGYFINGFTFDLEYISHCVNVYNRKDDTFLITILNNDFDIYCERPYDYINADIHMDYLESLSVYMLLTRYGKFVGLIGTIFILIIIILKLYKFYDYMLFVNREQLYGFEHIYFQVVFWVWQGGIGFGLLFLIICNFFDNYYLFDLLSSFILFSPYIVVLFMFVFVSFFWLDLTNIYKKQFYHGTDLDDLFADKSLKFHFLELPTSFYHKELKYRAQRNWSDQGIGDIPAIIEGSDLTYKGLHHISGIHVAWSKKTLRSIANCMDLLSNDFYVMLCRRKFNIYKERNIKEYFYKIVLANSFDYVYNNKSYTLDYWLDNHYLDLVTNIDWEHLFIKYQDIGPINLMYQYIKEVELYKPYIYFGKLDFYSGPKCCWEFCSDKVRYKQINIFKNIPTFFIHSVIFDECIFDSFHYFFVLFKRINIFVVLFDFFVQNLLKQPNNIYTYAEY